jgi:ketosteroid isomerase-like protein
MPYAMLYAAMLVRSLFRRRVLFLLAVLMFVAAPLLYCQTHDMSRAKRHQSRHEIDQLEEKWRQAELKGDMAALDSLLADDFMAILPNGMLQTKAQALEALSSATTHIATLELSDRKVRFYGNTALVTSRAEVSGNVGQRELNGCYRYTRVYVRDARGVWRIVNFEASRIHDPEERADRK